MGSEPPTPRRPPSETSEPGEAGTSPGSAGLGKRRSDRRFRLQEVPDQAARESEWVCGVIAETMTLSLMTS